ncbi:hypothetical protein NDQ72_01350 [Halomonas sp. KG2]|uniref:hypothetical protein n=1 Tax=Halomonas sp. KG2 TaxID=2951138 RepID=UPI00264A194F|nr:hypothetical protein [Halomonas sp. KG2]WKD28620.1 hypothetical protein NDQ72_01350 [Halomonas sp. KG2]
MDNYTAPLVAITALCISIAIGMLCYGGYPKELREKFPMMHNPIPKDWRYVIKFTVLAFCVGSAFQLGISIASNIKPRVEVIEIREVIEMRNEAKPSAKGIAQRFDF